MNKYKSNICERVSKNKAKSLYNAGFTVFALPCKVRPVFPSEGGAALYYPCEWNLFTPGSDMKKAWDFEKLVNAYSYYNCNYNELGKYIAFYVKSEKISIHFSFSDGSNPYLFRGTIFDCLKELKKWKKNWIIEPLKSGFYLLTEKGRY
jgi:hypothetical protein